MAQQLLTEYDLIRRQILTTRKYTTRLDLTQSATTLQLTDEARVSVLENPLTAIPPEIGRLTHLRELYIAFPTLTELPSQIGDLKNLETLSISGGGIRALPPEIAQLTNLHALRLNTSSLQELPPHLAQLSRLEILLISSSSLDSLPGWIGKLKGLTGLHLVGNRLTQVPREVGQLTNLEALNLSNNWLASLPDEISQLQSLTELSLSGNLFEVLPSSITALSKLQVLDLSVNRLSTVPPDIARLRDLESLNLINNPLRALPEEIGELENLLVLQIAGGELTTLPSAIGRLSRLQRLNAMDNQIVNLPPRLGRLHPTIEINLKGNPLREPLPRFLDRGVEQLFVYLRSLVDAKPQYEAKLLLVGEGNVGKTSLLAALRQEPFVENRPTTHGIELNTLLVRHPSQALDITLNTWDFGGQEVYRITHQFFFSRRALYLLVWRPREGQEENAIEAWIRRIRLRIGDEARIIIVATHSEERNPELDYPGLKREFGDILLGHYRVDNRSSVGLKELREAIAREASKLPQMGELLSTSWVAAREAIARRAREETQIPQSALLEICRQHQLDEDESEAFASLLHDLGHIIYYADSEGLRDMVVLQPEWLTKAIGYVLEDRKTREDKGLLIHARLKEIWGNRNNGSYAPRHFPYFLRLMEKFDVSYRLPDEQSSLIGQLVPYERPRLPWDREGGRNPYGDRSLSLFCSMNEPAPGMIAWLTVRNHRFSSGLHWRSGVFLVHEAYGSQGLFELVDDRNLSLTVRAPSPDHFFSLLRDSVEDLITSRWKGLSYEFLVPCRSWRCSGRLKFRSLLRCRERGKVTMDCPECTEPQNVAWLLTGFALPETSLERGLESVQNQLAQVTAGLERVEVYAAESARQVRAVLRAVETEIADCPRLFVLAPAGTSGWRFSRIWQQRFVLTLWCEHPGQEHPQSDATYEFARPREWLDTVSPYVILIGRTLRLLVPVAGDVPGVVLPEHQLRHISHQLELMKSLASSLPYDLGRSWSTPATIEAQSARLTAAEGAGLRALRALLFEQDRSRSFGDLRRVRTVSGDLLWVCPTHYREYDPGLPDVR